VNALSAKDGRALWKEIVKAYRQGDAPEMVHGLLHWKARDLMQKGSKVWAPEEARKLSRDLIVLLSDSRGRDLPLGQALERFALSL
jgi:AmiR/NasT family two-component response regulator